MFYIMYSNFVVELMCLNLAVIVSFLIQNGIFRNLLSFGLLAFYLGRYSVWVFLVSSICLFVFVR